MRQQLSDEVFFPFSTVLVLDALPLTAVAFCALASDVAGRPAGEAFASPGALLSRLAGLGGSQVLIIIHAPSAPEDIRILAELFMQVRAHPGCRVMLCADVTSPQWLMPLLCLRPEVLVLRQEPLSVLRRGLLLSGVAWPDTVLSPAVTDGLALIRGLSGSVTIPSLSVHASHRDVAAWRRRASQGESAGVFSWADGAVWDAQKRGDRPG